MLIYVVLATLLEGIGSVQLIKMEVPSHVPIGGDATLHCMYTLDTHEALYSVKWYHGNNEFYRYVPKDRPPGQVFGLQGDKVNLNMSTDRQVVLQNLDLSTSGLYLCEASADAPTFKTVTDSRTMMVIDLPDGGPKITGGRPKYRVGDTVRVNCSTLRSSPPATLEWYVNGKKVNRNILHEYPPRKFRDGRSSSKLGLEFRVTEHHFQNGGMTLRCVASIEPVYTVSNEQAVLGDLLTESALESRGSPNHVRTNNRADTGSSSRTATTTTTATTIILFLWITAFLFMR